VNARDFGVTDDPYQAAAEDVRPYRALTPRERYERFLDLMSFLEEIWRSLHPERRRLCERAGDALDDPGRWWQTVPSR